MFGPKREEKSDGKGGPLLNPLTFDCLLNCLDGVERSDGIFTIITTNDIAKVDPALGHPRVFLRIDEKGWVECGYCDRRFVLKGGPADDSATA